MGYAQLTIRRNRDGQVEITFEEAGVAQHYIYSAHQLRDPVTAANVKAFIRQLIEQVLDPAYV
jgi:hypothetical protein